MIPKPLVSPSPRPREGSWRRVVGAGLATCFCAFCLLISTWGLREFTCGHMHCTADTSLLAPLVSASPLVWLVASVIVGAFAMLVHAIAIRKGGTR